MGAMATTPITAIFTGDASLRTRPMARVLDPLTKFGATYQAQRRLMPLTVVGADRRAVHRLRSDGRLGPGEIGACFWPALNALGRTRIVQSALTRDHTEKMLKAFGAEISVNALADGGEEILVMGEVELKPCAVEVPRDPSSAAFPLVAALIVPGSEITMPSVLLNPRRIGLIETLKEMGADIEIKNRRESGGEEIGDLVARHSELKGVDVPADRAPSMIDEYPILAVAASFAQGKTTMRGLEELRVKESDRLSAVVAGLGANGVMVEELPDGMVIEGLARVRAPAKSPPTWTTASPCAFS